LVLLSSFNKEIVKNLRDTEKLSEKIDKMFDDLIDCISDTRN